jgi:cytoskeletal protein CcmA (bactofilin family)
MSDFFQQKTIQPNSGSAVIGKGMRIKGSIRSEQDVFLDGEVEGELNVENFRLIIGPHGKAIANARAREVDIHGSIQGDVDSTDKICVRSGARLVGDIRTAGIVIEDGAYFRGGVDIVKAEAKPEIKPEVKPEIKPEARAAQGGSSSR